MSAFEDQGRAWIGRGGRWRVTRLLLGLAAGPAAWALQLEAGYAISSYACFPHDAPFRRSPPPGWSAEPAILLAINLGCLALSLAGLAVAATLLTRTRRADPQEPVLRRTRFMALCGVLTDLGFAAAILVNTVTIVMTPACWSIRT
jgi:hypothetical protein